MPGSVPGAGSPAGQQPSGTAWELTCERDLLYAASFVGDSIPVRVFLESGVYFPLIDSALVWSHPGFSNPSNSNARAFPHGRRHGLFGPL
ncbi:hypothetical protein [Alistipes sp.]|uniref:hypothetical protein n=1 Tax=Alistipes sp. TaxID=1872444 RepID=UPI00132B0F3B|nr:hypothetical protein [Alistipes sp.]MUU02177.1 hypothetical protein [Alistipes sp.]